MDRKVWSAKEIELLTPSEQDDLFESSIVDDLDQVPSVFLDRVKVRLNARIASESTGGR